MLTSYTDDEALFAAVRAGAAGFLLKEVSQLDLVAAVRMVAAGGTLLDPKMTEAVLRGCGAGRAPTPATPRSTSGSGGSSTSSGRAITNRQIGARLHLAEKTVKNHVTVLLRKLGLQRRAEAAAYAARHRLGLGRMPQRRDVGPGSREPLVLARPDTGNHHVIAFQLSGTARPSTSGRATPWRADDTGDREGGRMTNRTGGTLLRRPRR
jgi:hypothetical protein